MSLTEEHARKKWCPFARMADCDRGFGYNRWENKGPETARCIASGCMAWRWGEEQMAKHNNPGGVSVSGVVNLRGNQPKEQKTFEKAGYREGSERDQYTLIPRHGYCGLAGRDKQG